MIIAAFATETAMRDAVASLRRDGACSVETFSAVPPYGNPAGSVVPLLMLGGGMLGAVGGFGMQVYATTLSYPQDVGGRPDLSWPSYIPASFELAVMGAMLAGMIGYFITVRLPRLYDPVDEGTIMRDVMTGRHVLVIHAGDGEAARAMLIRHGALTIEEIGS